MAFWPCSDMEACDGHMVEHSENHQPTDHQDNCSPFCVCACCGVSIEFTPAYNQSESVFALCSDPFSQYELLYAFSYKKRIFHPPLV